ncbi:putative holin-like toxin [Staphylococcus aureus]|nr:putative holin-like toxin [Staphylococcus aureus]
MKSARLYCPQFGLFLIALIGLVIKLIELSNKK